MYSTLYIWHLELDQTTSYATIENNIEKAKQKLWKYLKQNNLTDNHNDVDSWVVNTLGSSLHPDTPLEPKTVLIDNYLSK